MLSQYPHPGLAAECFPAPESASDAITEIQPVVLAPEKNIGIDGIGKDGNRYAKGEAATAVHAFNGNFSCPEMGGISGIHERGDQYERQVKRAQEKFTVHSND